MTERDQYIIKSYTSGKTAREIALSAGCCYGTVFNVLKRNGINTRVQKIELSEEQKEDIVKDYLSGKSMMSIMNDTGVYYDVIKNIINEHGVDKLSYSKLKNINLIEDYFKNIDTNEKAYWLGWIISDGCVYGNKLQIALSKKDRYILEMFESDICVEGRIYDYSMQGNAYSKFEIGCKNMIQDLNSLGITENKTFSVKVPTLKEKELNRHLIRGLFDGDGCIYIGKRKSGINAGQYSYELSFTGNIHVIQFIKDTLENSICNLSRKHIEDNHSVKRIRWSGVNDIKLIRDYMYKQANDHFLKRKRDKMYLLS